MKKILTLATILAAAGVVNAASLNWSVSNVYQPGTTTPASGYAAYLFITEQSGDFGAKTTTADSIVTLMKSGSDISEYIAATGATNTKGMISGATGYYANFGEGDSLTAFAVIVDASNYTAASNYIITAERSASWTSSTGAKMLGFGSQSSQTWTSVPEPGTAALALLGIGMMIRRRRA